MNELTATLSSFGPRFVEFINGDRRSVAVNPEHVAVVIEFHETKSLRWFCTLVAASGQHLTDVEGTLDEVVAKLTGEADQ